MFNLSDKELDRLSREAASQHDPGDQLMGPGAWEKLEVRLDQELGRTATPSPNPLRGIRRLPFQYAPVILLVVGVTYYAVKQYIKPKKAEPSGSPPLTVVRNDPSQPGQTITDPSSKTLDNRENSTPEKDKTAQYPVTGDPADPARQPGSPSTSVGSSTPASGTPAGSSPLGTPGINHPSGDHMAGRNPSGFSPSGVSPSGISPSGISPSGASPSGVSPSSTNPSGVNPSGISPSGRLTPRSPAPGSKPGSTLAANSAGSAPGNNIPASHDAAPSTLSPGATAHTTGKPLHEVGAALHTPSRGGGHVRPGRSGRNHVPTSAGEQTDAKDLADAGSTRSKDAAARTSGSPTGNSGAPAADESGPRFSYIRQPFSLRSRPIISDSALLAYTPPKKEGRSLHINRSLQLGLLLAPDFSSVNSLAGDKPGSSIGITADYQFFNRLYLGTGILFSKKNYTARVQDCHVPNDYFRMVGLHDVAFIKGSLNMLEIPLNLRYDFSVTGNTLFFLSAGASSYIMLNQQSDYYYNSFGREAHRRFNYRDKEAYLLSAFNLSMGVETGISNSLSLMVAPYIKLPTRSIGFGEIKMNSVGINLALKFAPVLSRTRK